MTPRNYRIAVAPAIELDIGETGARDGRPVILIHGLSDSWPSFLPLMGEMPDDVRLIAVSLRGHGDSTRIVEPCSLVDMARDVLAVMDSLGLARADLIGHSLGTTVAQKLTELAPDRVASLTLIGAFIRMSANPAVLGFRDDGVAPLRDPVDPNFIREFQESAVGPDTPRETIERAVAESRKLTALDWKAALDAAIATDLTHALAGYRGPVLVLHGQLDDFCLPEEQLELAQGENRRLVSEPQWGHSPHWEHPAAAATLIAEFLTQEATAA